jgi:sugar phosphate isomerase/epimerase
MPTGGYEMKLAAMETIIPGATFAEKLKNAQKYGFDGIELSGYGLKERLKEIKSAVADSPLPVCAINRGYRGYLLSPDATERDTCVSDLMELLDLAGEFKASGVTAVPSLQGRTQMPDLSPLAAPLDLETKLLTRTLDQLGRYAQNAGTALLLEPVNRYETHYIKRVAEGVEICKRVGSPGIKVCANAFHMNIEERDTQKIIKRHKPWLWHIHLADSNRYQPGLGHINFRKTLKALAQAGFDRYLSLDCSIYGRPETELPKTQKYLRSFVGMYKGKA